MALGPEVMLASSSSKEDPLDVIARLQRAGWSFEIKFDGIRAAAERSAAGTRIFNRRRADITHRYPDVVAQLDANGFLGLVDGEIVVAGVAGRPEFSLAHLRDAQSSPRGVQAAMARAPATFMPFDALRDGDEDLRALPYTARREHLRAMLPAQQISTSSADGTTMWSFVQQQGLEGLIAKRPDSAYRAGKQQAWVKIKLTRRLSALICGVVAGKGSRGAIGALTLCLWDPEAGRLVDVGNVGSGLSNAQISEIQRKLHHATPIVVEIEYLSVSVARNLRMPVFKSIRTDVDPSACTVDQLG